jgi:hypothetical protein
MAKQDWMRLADFVISRRTELGLRTRRDLSRVTGVNDRTIGKLELGQSVSAATVGAIERVLGWEPGSGRHILNGGEPTLRDTPPPRPTTAYNDPVLQAAWESLASVDLPDEIKRGMIAFARARREDDAERRVG